MRFQMIATYTTLTSNVVVTAIQEVSVDAQVKATRELVDAETKSVQILRYQLTKGYASRLDVAAQEAQLAQAKATLPPLIKQAAQLHDQLAVLCGQFPSQAPPVNFELSSLQLPQDIPVSLPSALVSQRPDVLQAQENLHAASANIGVAVANRLPNIQLTANAGSTALASSAGVFGPGTGFYGASVRRWRNPFSMAASCCMRSAAREPLMIRRQSNIAAQCSSRFRMSQTRSSRCSRTQRR